jgi:hypothetical protein
MIRHECLVPLTVFLAANRPLSPFADAAGKTHHGKGPDEVAWGKAAAGLP